MPPRLVWRRLSLENEIKQIMYDINKVRADFPILSREVYNRPLVYLDNAATTQKPLCVLDAMREEYLNVNANCAPRSALPFAARHRPA